MIKQEIRSSKAPAPIGPYSQAIKVGNLVYVSGQIALDAATNKLITSTIEEEADRVLLNITSVLQQAGASLDDVVKTTIFLKNMDDFNAVNGVYAEYFTAPFPARETVQVSKLPMDVSVEISVVAIIR